MQNVGVDFDPVTYKSNLIYENSVLIIKAATL